ncbi:metalloendopeptidase [Aureococcus anophagefferens]|nr:metalloendopeptidase [Aureococcus anophagefferens]
MAGSSSGDALLRSLRYSYRCVVAAVGAACRPGGAARCDAAGADGHAPELLSRVVDDAAAGRVDRVLIGAETLEVWAADAKLYDAAMVPWLDAIVAVVAPCAYLIFAYKVLMRASRGPVDESVAKRYRKKRELAPTAGFAGVAGVDGARRELEEIVAVVQDPGRFRAMGAKCPRGVLLTGPSAARGPGRRARDLFKRARSMAPCVVFIDEIDAIAKARGLLGQSDEREQTLNQILCELDGFDAKADDSELVILLAATNRPEILDAALVRPGRLDRCVTVPLPDEDGREAILRVHGATIRLDAAADLRAVARAATGFSGADLANAVNEAALLAVRTGAPSAKRTPSGDRAGAGVISARSAARSAASAARRSLSGARAPREHGLRAPPRASASEASGDRDSDTRLDGDESAGGGARARSGVGSGGRSSSS